MPANSTWSLPSGNGETLSRTGALKNTANTGTAWPALSWPIAHSIDAPMAVQLRPSTEPKLTCSSVSVARAVPVKRTLLIVLPLTLATLTV